MANDKFHKIIFFACYKNVEKTVIIWYNRANKSKNLRGCYETMDKPRI